MIQRTLFSLAKSSSSLRTGSRMFSTQAAKSAKKMFNSKALLTSAGLATASTLFLGYKQFTAYMAAIELKEVDVGPEDLLQDGEMKEVQVGPNKEDIVLIARVDGEYYCVGAKCSHFAFNLAKGLLFDDKVICPLHNAAFSVKTGLYEQGPVLDGIPTYEIRRQDGRLIVRVPSDLHLKQAAPLARHNPEHDKRRFLIIGGGPSAISAAETLRQSGFEGEIIMVSSEDCTPYDRTSLSKNILGVEHKQVAFRDDSFFQQHDINFIKGETVENVDPQNQEVHLRNGQNIKYDRLLVATGAKPRMVPVNGHNLQNVFTLRSLDDVHKIRDAAKQSKNILIVGASFIGLESAWALKRELKDNVTITVIDMINAPMERNFGADIGNYWRKVHEGKGIKFVFGQTLQSIEGEGQAKEVVLSDGSRYSADLILIGVGVAPNTEILKNKVELAQDGGVMTDPFLRTSNPNIFAAGDIANYPYFLTGDRIRVEHYNEAIEQGSVAAFNMLDKQVPHSSVPFFWTRQWDQSLLFTGYSQNWDDIVVDGNIAEGKFVAYYIKNNQVTAAAGLGVPNSIMLINQALKLNLMPSADQIRDKTFNIEDLKKRLATEKKGQCKCKRGACLNKKSATGNTQ